MWRHVIGVFLGTVVAVAGWGALSILVICFLGPVGPIGLSAAQLGPAANAAVTVVAMAAGAGAAAISWRLGGRPALAFISCAVGWALSVAGGMAGGGGMYRFWPFHLVGLLAGASAVCAVHHDLRCRGAQSRLKDGELPPPPFSRPD